MKFTLHTKSILESGPGLSPSGTFELDDDRIAATGSNCGVEFPWESRGCNAQLWVVSNAHGALGAVWARNEQDALDELVDRDLGAGLLVDEPKDEAEAKEYEEVLEYAHLGDAGEWADLSNAWLAPVEFKPERDIELIVKLAEARGAGVTLLSKA